MSGLSDYQCRPAARVVLALVCLLFLSVSSTAGEGTTEEKPLKKGFHELELTLEGGETLRYGLSLPRLKAGEPVPLVVALHFGGQVTPYIGMTFMKILVAPAFRKLGAIIIAPDCPGQGWTDPKSEQAVLELLDHTLAAWPVDRDRVVVTGFSMGGMGTWHFAAKHPGRFSAAVPVAGGPRVLPDGSVPIYALLSHQDELIAVEPVQEAIAALQKSGARAELVFIEGPTHYQTDLFVKPLSRAVPWLEQIWAGTPPPKNDD